jgi:hypothetical protein
VRAFALDLRDAPLTGETLTLRIDGRTVALGARAALGHRLHLVKAEGPGSPGFPPEQGLAKRPGLSGPLTDAYFERMVHVYGTQRAEHAPSSRSWPRKARAAGRSGSGRWSRRW